MLHNTLVRGLCSKSINVEKVWKHCVAHFYVSHAVVFKPFRRL